MNLVETIKGFFSDNKKDKPKGYCPNCWGRQQYEGHLYEAILNEGISAQNISAKTGWIEAYAKENLGGIRLVKDQDEQLVCPTCKVVFKPS
ncbi:MAG: hypothetical protein KJP00_10805 [Bacteroidia bacterium]|nr:hypothetical protein [Bacteroidia bacterium]